MISVIICSIDERKFAAVTANYRALLADTLHEIIGIHDARSLAEGYNRGVGKSRGELLIFSHDDIEILTLDFADALRRAMDSLDVVGIVGTSRVNWAFWPAAGHPYLHGWIGFPERHGGQCSVSLWGVDGAITTGLQALDGMFFAAKRAVLDRVPFDESTFDGFHCYDIDFSFAAHLAGFRVGVTAEIAIIHASGGNFSDDWGRFADRFDAKYPDRMTGTREVGNWASMRRMFATKEAFARECSVEGLMAATRQMRAQMPADA